MIVSTTAEVPENTKMMSGAREQAIDRMIAEAAAMGADAVTKVRMTTSMVMRGTAEILCYGTAVKLGSEPNSQLSPDPSGLIQTFGTRFPRPLIQIFES